MMTSGYALIRPSVALADGPQCYILTQAGYYRRIATGCPPGAINVDLSVDSSKPPFTCFFQSDTAQRQDKKTFQTKNCLEMATANQKCVETKCYPNATADGTGGSVPLNGVDDKVVLNTGAKGDKCGGGTAPNGAVLDSVDTIINIGCRGKGNPIVDLAFAIIRILSIGVGIVVVGSIIVAGIQYTTAGGDPQKTAAAIKRISNTVGALVLYIFAYALLNWLIPAGVFGQ